MAARIAVIGAGVAGSAAAMRISAQGARVTLFDRFAFGHNYGSSFGATRLFRTAYYEHPDYVPILQRARELWKAFEREAGETLFVETGVLEAGPRDGALMCGLNKAVESHRLAVNRLTAGDISRNYPQLTLPTTFEAIVEKQAGFVFADKTVAAQIRAARESGATLRPQTRIHSWSPVKEGVAVITDEGEEIFDRLVIAAGAWSNALLDLPTAGVAPIQKTLFWRRAPTSAYDLGGRFTPFLIETEEARLFYGFPAIDADGVKIAEHTGGEILAAADNRSFEPQPHEEGDIDAFLAATIPGLAGRSGKRQSCLYEASIDRHFLIDRHPKSDRVVFAAGLSGHGFKFAPVLGEALCRMALDGAAPDGWNFLSLARFA